VAERALRRIGGIAERERARDGGLKLLGGREERGRCPRGGDCHIERGCFQVVGKSMGNV
jgi:hypothetical protein